jgi:hypothetical protein
MQKVEAGRNDQNGVGRAWMTVRTIGRKETVAKIKDFLKRIDHLGAFAGPDSGSVIKP